MIGFSQWTKHACGSYLLKHVSVLLMAEKHILCICSFLYALYPMDVCLVVLQTLVVRNNAAMTIHT